MQNQTNSCFQPLDTRDAQHPVLYIDTQAPLSDLAACAAHRFTVVRDLMDTLTSLTLNDTHDCDLERVTRGVHLLTRGGCALLETLQFRAERFERDVLNARSQRDGGR